MADFPLCPMCEEGYLIEKEYEDTIQYKHAIGHLAGFKYSVCNCCDAEITNHLQAKHNKLAVVDFKRATDGLLTTYQIKEIVNTLGISLTEASNVIGGGPVSFSKYVNGSINQSLSVDTTLRLLMIDPAQYLRLKKIYEERQTRPSEPYQIYLHLKDSEPSAPRVNHAISAYVPDTLGLTTLAARIFSETSEPAEPQGLISRFFRAS
ncbi:type II toxin-antitoxin system MqsA family antitoxin [Pseudomonas putida]|nr:type II toxin-antitoxin system MqsA family antitoxin [Pseudomonas putida]MDY4320819.1 type II toxin-antitoxin system MqsA family antitoxin [Pseudomonas putida]MDY4354082.1 type II toxin-antitoxin system MqsA family antitoxin [Pseudomonas putida]